MNYGESEMSLFCVCKQYLLYFILTFHEIDQYFMIEFTSNKLMVSCDGCNQLLFPRDGSRGGI